MADIPQISYANELARKGIHLLSLLIPIIYLQIDTPTALLILVPMTVVAIAIDTLMYFHGPTRTLMHALVGSMLRSHERDSNRFLLTGASWVLIAATMVIALFPKVIAVTAFTILIVSDTFAALVGRRWGRHRFLDKSLVGTATFVATAVFCVVVYDVIYALPPTFVLAGCLGSLVGGIVEAASIRLRLDDNLSIPGSIALVMLGIDLLLPLFSLPTFSKAL